MIEKPIDEIQDLHKPFATWLKDHKIKYSKKNWNNHKRQGDEGIPDFIISIYRGKTIYIEFKTPEKYNLKEHGLSLKQQEWRVYLVERDHFWFICTSVQQAIDIILTSDLWIGS